MPLKHDVTEVMTPDGVKGLLINVPDAPIFHFEIFFHGGYHSVDGVPQQTAHVLEHMVANDTTDPRYRKKDAFHNDLYRNGAYTNAATYYAGIWYYVDCAVDEWQRMLRLYRLAIEKPLLTESTLKAELGNAAGEMKRNINQYSRLSSELAKNDLDLESYTSAEHVAAFDDVTLQGIKDHYTRTHTLANMQFIITGDLDGRRDDVVNELSGWSLEKGALTRSHALKPKTGGSYVYKQSADLPSVYVTLAIVLGRSLTSVEAQAFELINSYLFNVLNSKVYGEVRRRGLAYELHGYVDQYIEGHSLWVIWAPIPAENVGTVLDLIFDALTALLHDEIPAARFDYAKTYSTGRVEQSGQTVASLNDLYSLPYSQDRSIARYENVPEVFDEVTPALVRSLVREFLAGNSWSLAGVGAVPESEFATHYKTCKSFFDEVK